MATRTSRNTKSMIRGTNIHSRGTRHYGERASSDRVDPMPALGRSWGTLVALSGLLAFASLSKTGMDSSNMSSLVRSCLDKILKASSRKHKNLRNACNRVLDYLKKLSPAQFGAAEASAAHTAPAHGFSHLRHHR